MSCLCLCMVLSVVVACCLHAVFVVAVRCICVSSSRRLFCVAVVIVGCLHVCDCLMLFVVCSFVGCCLCYAAASGLICYAKAQEKHKANIWSCFVG